MKENCSLVINSNGKEYPCFYDIEDHEIISRSKWSLHSKGYAQTTINGKTILMHRLILNVDSFQQVDHKNHAKLDNRKTNLRICTPSENRRNSQKFTGVSSFKGIYFDNGIWHVQIKKEKVKNLGRYHSEKTAAKVYDQYARKLFKEYACTNFPEFQIDEQLTLNFR